jgi:large subunit ribosomal protein L10
MNRDQKAAVVDTLAGELREADAVFVVDYRGISVPQVAELRSRLRDADARFRVVKNSLTERAADQAGVDGIRELLTGPTALTFVHGDAALAAKALADAARRTQVLEFKGGLLNGSTLTADDIRSIARLPAREVLYGHLVGVVASPVTTLVRGLNGLLSGLAVALGQMRDEGKVGGDAPAAGALAPAAEPEPETREAAESEPPPDPDAEPPEPVPSPDSPEGEPTAPGPDQAEGDHKTTDPTASDAAVPSSETQEDES